MYVNSQRQKNEHMIPTELHSEEHHSWTGGWEKFPQPGHCPQFWGVSYGTRASDTG